MTPATAHCEVCLLEVERGSSYCPIHARAAKNLRQGFNLWGRAYGRITLPEYLRKLSNLAETGSRVKELIEYYVKNPEKWE
ncbi:MAG TPA: hypothetical protein VE177_02905 [Candidatus Binatus sp.]|nr:hypothetical protein [Candidatus Binatus sp.]